MTSTDAVVTIAHGRHRHLRRQHESLVAGRLLPDLYVVVAMSDPDLERWRARRTVAAAGAPRSGGRARSAARGGPQPRLRERLSTPGPTY